MSLASFRLALSLFATLVLLTGCANQQSSGSTAAAVPSVPAPAAASPSAITSPGAAGPSSSPAALVSPTTGSSAASGEVTVFAAASLTDAFKEIADGFRKANPGATVALSFGSSGTLATQLSQGAKADVFASADTIQMGNAQKADVLVQNPSIFARNRLTLIVPKDNPMGIQSLADLARPGVKFVTTAVSVPVGQYTRNVLQKASQDPSYGADFQSRVEANIVSNETDVKGVVTKVALGEADAGVCYTTDVTPDVRDRLQQIQIPDSLNQIAEYPIAVTKGSNQSGGQAFVAYVLSPAGQAVLAGWGFLPPATS